MFSESEGSNLLVSIRGVSGDFFVPAQEAKCRQCRVPPVVGQSPHSAAPACSGDAPSGRHEPAQEAPEMKRTKDAPETLPNEENRASFVSGLPTETRPYVGTDTSPGPQNAKLAQMYRHNMISGTI